MSKKFLKQLGNIVVLQAAGYAVGEVMKTVGPKIKKLIGFDDVKQNNKQEKKVEKKDDLGDLIKEAKESVKRKHADRKPDELVEGE